MVKNNNNADTLKTKWENLLYKVDLFTRKLGIFKFFAHYLSCYNKVYTTIVRYKFLSKSKVHYNVKSIMFGCH
jgi:hypothetical protein